MTPRRRCAPNLCCRSTVANFLATQPQDAPGAARRPVGAALLQALRAYAEQFLEAAYEVCTVQGEAANMHSLNPTRVACGNVKIVACQLQVKSASL